MFFAPALQRNSVTTPRQRASDLGFERFMSETFGGLLPGFHELQEDDKSWTVTLDVPGLARNQLRVNVVGRRVEVESAKEAKRQVRAVYELPNEIDADKSEAALEDGVLTLKLAKADSAIARQIKVS